MNLIFAGQSFILHPSGALFWEEQGMLIASDLHLEKGSHYAKRGFFLPPYDSHETLTRLLDTCRDLSPRRLLLLGDCFHDAEGYLRLRLLDRTLFDQLQRFDPVWIQGNHDGDFVPRGFTCHTEWTMEGITFRHEAQAGATREISGHFHPKADIMHKEAIISRRCFIADGNRMILPSFGAYTGGLSVDHPSIAALFTNPQTYILGESRIYHFAA